MRFSKLFILGMLVVFSISLAAQMEESEEHSGRHCSLRTLKGSYGSFAQGTILAQFPGFPN